LHLLAVRWSQNPIAIVTYLIEHGADVNAQTTATDIPSRPLDLAILFQKRELITILLGAGANPRLINKYSRQLIERNSELARLLPNK
jgi:ankyrin repeat protein